MSCVSQVRSDRGFPHGLSDCRPATVIGGDDNSDQSRAAYKDALIAFVLQMGRYDSIDTLSKLP